MKRIVTDRRVVIAGGDGGKGVCADCDVGIAGRVGEERRRANGGIVGGGPLNDLKRRIAERHIVASARHGTGGGALHGEVADCRVVAGGRCPLQGVIAQSTVRAAGGLVQRLIPDRRAVSAIRDGGERKVADRRVVFAGRILRRERRFTDCDAGRVLVGKRKNARTIDLIRAGAGGATVGDVEIPRIVERRALDPARRHEQIIGRAALVEAGRCVFVERQRRVCRRARRKLDVQAAARRADRAGDVRRRRHWSPGRRTSTIAFELIERAIVADHAGRRGRTLGARAVGQRDRPFAGEGHDRAIIRRDADREGRPTSGRRQTAVNRVADIELGAGAVGGFRQAIADQDIAAARRNRAARVFAQDDVGVAGDAIPGLETDERIVGAAGDAVACLIAEHCVVGGGSRDRRQGRIAYACVVVARQRIGARALHRQIAERGVVRAGRSVLHSFIADGGIWGCGVDRGLVERVVADGEVAGGSARDRSERVVADGDVTRARCGQWIGAGAEHGVIPDSDVVGAGRDIESGVIAEGVVRVAGRVAVECTIADRCAVVTRREAEGGIADSGVVCAGGAFKSAIAADGSVVGAGEV